MQLRLSLVTCAFLATTIQAEDYISVQYMGYDEDSGRTTIHTPAIEINKDFGADYTLNMTFVHDSVSGASPTYYDASSGASATLPEGSSLPSNIRYGDIPYEEKRNAFSATLTKRFASRDELTVGYSYSNEDDYTSNEISLSYLHYLDASKNRSVSLGFSYQKNDVGIYCFLGTSACDSSSGASGMVEKDIDVYNIQLGYSQVIDKRSVVKGALFMIQEDGYLSNPYMHIVRDFHTTPRITEETKPDARTAYGFSVEYDRSWSNTLSTVVNYRFYDDDWDITSHTLDTKLYYEWSDRLRTGLNFRAYTQSKASFFSGKRDYFTDQKYASSDRRVSEFDAYTYGVTLDYQITDRVGLNLSVGYYDQPEYFDATYYNVGFKYKF